MQIILIPSELQMYTDLYHLKISPRIFGLMLFSLAVNVKVKVLCVVIIHSIVRIITTQQCYK